MRRSFLQIWINDRTQGTGTGAKVIESERTERNLPSFFVAVFLGTNQERTKRIRARTRTRARKGHKPTTEERMQIVEKKLTELIPYKNNPRHNEEAVPLVENSIREFGFKVPIVIDRNNVIVCGHTRYLAAQGLEMDTVPCEVADDLTDKQIKAFRLAGRQ